MNEFHDEVLGRVVIRRHHQARYIRFRVSQKGVLTVSAAPRTSDATIKRATKSSRKELLVMLDDYRSRIIYRDGQEIGKSHKLYIQSSPTVDQLSVITRDRLITAMIPPDMPQSDNEPQLAIQSEVIKALKKESRVYLGRRLAHLAKQTRTEYERIRYTHSGTRWGSCSSTGTISLNIALMMLPLELIDYVLIHELCHTKQMNHSQNFWKLVQEADPRFKLHRRELKRHTPGL